MSEKIVLYSRVSTENQDLEDQKERLKDWAEREEYEYDLYAEKVSSVKERPKFEEIMDNLDKYDLLVVTKIDRFARSLNDLLDRIEYLKEKDVGFKAIDQPINTEKEPYGDLMFKMLGVFADFERKMIRKRMERGFEKAKEEGRVGRPTKELPRNELETKYKKGWNYSALADHFDCSASTIKRRLKEYDIKD